MTTLDPSHLPISFGAKDPSKSRAQALLPTVASERLHLPAIPDYRFEQGYLKSIAPYVHWRYLDPEEQRAKLRGTHARERSEEGEIREQVVEATAVVESETDVRAVEITSIEWGRVTWITLRDQVISPLIQGTVWGVAGFYFRPVLSAIFAHRDGSSSSSPPLRKESKDGGAANWLRTKLRSVMFGGVETNLVLRGNRR